MENPESGVPLATQQAHYDVCLMFAKTFGTAHGKKCLEHLKKRTIYRVTPLDRYSPQGQFLLAGEQALKDFVLDIMKKIEQAKEGPPAPKETSQ